MRYFIVFYKFYTLTKQGDGLASFRADTFLNCQETIKWICDNNNLKTDQVMLTNFKEVTKEEYEFWNK